ncbi:MAG: transglutaminase-like domain-containing protein, partial [Oscillospiraceae bacterium]|nr:transglutaminase-like domain-containing protein [Oscillospiraceae bacterium]
QVPTVTETAASTEKSATSVTAATSEKTTTSEKSVTSEKNVTTVTTVPTADNTPKYSPPVVILPTAPGVRTSVTSKSVIDYSNTSDGYITLKYTGSQPKIIMQITAPNNRLYDLHMPADSALKAFPLSEGSGVYKITLYEGFNKDNGKVEAYHVDSQEIQVSINNPNMPFLMSNTYVNYNANSAAVAKAAEICGGKSEIEKVEVIYNWIVENISYDHDKAANVQSGYIPNLTDFMSSKKGICFDYASGMAAMLRTQGIPAKLQVGWAGTIYHAWISCYTKESGWVNFWIKFDGSKWTMMEPTFNSTVGNSESEFKNFQNFVGNSGNYQLLFNY